MLLHNEIEAEDTQGNRSSSQKDTTKKKKKKNYFSGELDRPTYLLWSVNRGQNKVANVRLNVVPFSG